MTQVPFKSFFIALAVITLLLFATGIIAFKQDGYACAGGWDVGFRKKVELLHFGPVHIFGYPFTRECEQRRRYDPSNVQSCVDTGFCSLKSAASNDD